MQRNDKLHAAILEFIGELPPRIRTLRAAAGWDLNFGPHAQNSVYKGFESACRELRTWYHDNVPTLYYEAWSGYVTDCEPEPEERVEAQELDPNTVKRALFGALAEYV